MEKRWMVYTKRADFEEIGKHLGVDPILVRIMRNRGLKDEAEMARFLTGGMETLYDAALLPDAGDAAADLRRAILAGAHIRIVGDYDIDGVCSTCLLYEALHHAREKLVRKCPETGARKACVDWTIPDRVRDGYGINLRIVEEAAADGVDLLLTCDNGIAAIEELARARALGMRVIVTDHHDVRLVEEAAADVLGADDAGRPAATEGQLAATTQTTVPELLPPADRIVNPKLRESRYPTREICGAVVAWKLVKLLYEICEIPETDWLSLLEYAAIATVGDIMPLNGENRVIVREGLRRINDAQTALGLAKLIEACGLSGKTVTAYHIGFVLGPCINAAGRLESAETAVRLFLSKKPAEAAALAEHLRCLNQSRKDMTERGAKEALLQASVSYPDDQVLVLYLPKLHESLCGIVAGRVREETGKPCFVLADGEDAVKGSGRSIPAYQMFRGLCEASPLLLKFGGHPMAAGLSIRKEAIGDLRRTLNERAKLTESDFAETVWIDLVLPFSALSFRLAEELLSLAPFGNGNERPLFAARNVRISSLRVLGERSNVLRFQATDEGGVTMTGICFGEAERMRAELSATGRAHLLYEPEINEYGGRRSLQLTVRDYRTC